MISKSMKKFLRGKHTAAAVAVALGLNATQAAATDVPIVSSFNGGTIVVAASADRFAGTIDSIIFNNVQYPNTYDHGRELSTALEVDNLGECFNPTEPGSQDDGTGPTSTSALQSISNSGNILNTQVNMANWLKPGEHAPNGCGTTGYTTGQNPAILSGYILKKTVSFYGSNIPNLFIDNVSITVPDTHSSTNTEAATAYLPPSFSKFLNYDRVSRTLTLLTATSSDPAAHFTSALYIPVIVATPNGTSAMGVISPSTYNGASTRPYYDYFAFPGNSATSKWSCVFGSGTVSPGSVLNYTCAVAVGSVDAVISAMNAYPDQSITANTPIFRFYNSQHHFLTPSYNEGASGTTFHFETTAFHLFPAGSGIGYYPLYRCYNPGVADHFISTQSNCEGWTQEGIYGYAAPSQQPGLYPLYRFFRGGAFADHLETITYSEGANNGYTFESILGYVVP